MDGLAGNRGKIMNKLAIVIYFLAWLIYFLISFKYKPRPRTAEQSGEVEEKDVGSK